MLEAYGIAISTLFQPVNLLIILVAVLVGLIVGIIPGIGGGTMIVILLPFIFRLPAEVALILLVALHAVVFTSGGITSILFNIPGESFSAATLLDGFPMTKKGEGGRAIGAAITSSVAGGIMPAFLALAMVPLVMPIIMAFGQPEMAMLVLLGISFLAALTGGSVIKGLISGMAGLLLSFVGYHYVTGVHRFSFGTTFLYDGIELIPLLLGLFGLAEIFYLVMKGETVIAQRVIVKLSSVTEGMKDVWRHRWLWFRSAIIGYIVGVIPGVGAGVATWVTYGQAKQTSKHPEKFGTGVVEGVIAPEAADNAKEAGSMLTTMALGIPGSATMALFLAAFLMVGVEPGPRMLTEHLPLALTLLLGIALANIIGGVICIFAAPQLVRLASVHLDFLFPGILIAVLIGIYVATVSPMVFIVALAFGILGLFMKRYGYSRPALILGFVLGGLFENYLLLSFKIYGPWFFARPIPLTMMVIMILMLNYPNVKRAILALRGRLIKV
ncbi:tripartite tricarboxylate transporter permease [Chloroflexota bacterium]